jgi:bacterioferritin-associated ferredoxin
MNFEPRLPIGSEEVSRCDSCPARIVCRCLKITEDAVIEAIVASGVSNLRELRRCTGAGQGCTACLRRLQLLIQEHAEVLAKAS